MNLGQFIDYCKALGIELTSEQLEQFERFFQILVEKNKKMNLTGITDRDDVYLKHFYDCLTMAPYLRELEVNKLCDVGGGAGFPSIPLKIVFPEIEVIVVDSLDKRIRFLNELASEIGLTGFKAVHARAEEYVKTKRDYFDVVTARAVARLNILSELCLPLTKKGGHFISLKAASGKEEVAEAKKGIAILGGRVIATDEFNLPIEESKRTIVKVRKVKDTPRKYPRNFGRIKKKPL
jgi:16S rRNA (guanine527-N7)-methyltransferase